MSRYTDYDAIDYKNYNMIGESQEFMRGVVYMADRIEEAPSIDIVHCRECRHYHVEKYHAYCGMLNIRGKFPPDPEPDDFCSYGEREGE